MSRFLPINQVRLTNVAVVRMNQGGKRFEIACYRNKVVDYRQGLEQDLSEVLQTDRVFTNVSKGQFAKAKDLQKVFGTKDEEEISKLILTKGQLQVSDKERSQQLEKTTAQVAEWISKNCVHPSSDRPYTISQIRHAMQQANFAVHPTKPLKRQYLDCVKLLQTVMPIQRAKMELSLIVPSDHESDIETALNDNQVEWSDDDKAQNDNTLTTTQYRVLVDPSLYRILNDIIEPLPGGRIEIITQVVTKQGDTEIELGLDHKLTHLENNGNDVDVTEKNLANLKIVDSQDEEKAKEQSEEAGSESGSSSDEELVVTNRRKQQKKARKKNQKAMRREEDQAGGGATSTSSASKQPQKKEQAPSVQTASVATPTQSSATAQNQSSSSSDGRKSCNTCGGFFDSATEYRAHFKSDWHRFNQKLKLKGAAPITEQEFLACDMDQFFGSTGGDDMML